MKRKLLIMTLALAMVFAYSLPVFNSDAVVNAAMGTASQFINDARWSNGVSWGDSQRPKISSWDSWSCCAYAADFAKYCYDANSPSSGTRFTNASEIRSGDIIHLAGNPEHWFVVISRSGNTLHTAEGNFSGRVRVATDVYTVEGSQVRDKYNGLKTIANGYHYTAAPVVNNPFGNLDSATGGEKSVYISGWAIDSDVLSTGLEIHVYIGGAAGAAGAEGHSGIYANKNRTDVGAAYPSAGSYHGFSETISTNKYGTQEVYVYAINQGSGNNALLGHKTVTITRDKPAISDIKVIGKGLDGYIVKCNVTAVNGLSRVQFPTWTERNGQDDLPTGWETNAKFSGTITKDPSYNNRYNIVYTVKASDHNNESGQYNTHIYAYDSLGQLTSCQTPAAKTVVSASNIDEQSPVISNVNVVTCTADQVVIEADVTDNGELDTGRCRAIPYYIIGDGRSRIFVGDFKWVSGNKIRFTLNGTSVTEKQEIELHVYDMSENEAVVTVPVTRTAKTYVNVQVGDTFSSKEFTGEGVSMGGNGLSNWEDDSYYGDVLRNNGDDTFTALKAGKCTLFFISAKYGTMLGCEVTVTDPSSGSDPGTDPGSNPANNPGGSGSGNNSSSNAASSATMPAGTRVQAGGCEYTVLDPASKTVVFTNAPNMKSVIVPETIAISGQTYRVAEVGAKAFTAKKIRTVTIGATVSRLAPESFAGSKATKMIVKTRLLKKASVRKSLKGSKIKNIKVKVGKKADNKKFVKKYKKIFTKKNAGKKASVK